MFSSIRSAALIGALAIAAPCTASAQIYNFSQAFGSLGSGNGQFNGPIAVALDPAGHRLFVVEFNGQRVQIIDSSTLAEIAIIGTTGQIGSDNAHFWYPDGIAFDPATNRIFVSDEKNDRVQVFDGTSYAYVATIGETEVNNGDNSHLGAPAALDIDTSTGRLLIADFGNGRVQVYDTANLTYQATIKTLIAPNTQSAPRDVRVDQATGQIWVADEQIESVEIFDGTSYAYQTSLVSPFGQDFHYVYNVSYDPGQNVMLVSDVIANRVVIYDAATARPLGIIGQNGADGSGNGQFSNPEGSVADPANNRVFVTDASNNRLQIFSDVPTPVISSVLPGSRSVEIPSGATIFATVINSGTTALDNCQIALPAAAPAGLTLSYQTTNRANNELTGTANTPVTIAGDDGIQTFLISFQGAAAFSAPGMPLDFDCDDAAPAAVISGVDTVDLTMSSTPIADIIALSATASGNGIAEVPQGGAGAFAVASDNLGATAPITVSVDTGSATLPVTATICQSNPTTGHCLVPAAASVTLTYAGGATPTFSIFLQSSGAIPFDPANSRVFVRFEDAAGGLHGSTSVAIETN